MDTGHEIIIGILTNILYAVLVSVCTLIFNWLRNRSVNVPMIFIGCFIVFLFTMPGFFLAYLEWEDRDPLRIFVRGSTISVFPLGIFGAIAGWILKVNDKPNDHWAVQILLPLVIYIALTSYIFLILLILPVLRWIFGILRYIIF
jgi:hypothetical protein